LAAHRSLDGGAALPAFVSLLAAAGEDVQESLAGTLGRPQLRIGYWLPEAERWVDRAGDRLDVDVSQAGVTVVSYQRERLPR
jgi:hypothetical protein